MFEVHVVDPPAGENEDDACLDTRTYTDWNMNVLDDLETKINAAETNEQKENVDKEVLQIMQRAGSKVFIDLPEYALKGISKQITKNEAVLQKSKSKLFEDAEEPNRHSLRDQINEIRGNSFTANNMLDEQKKKKDKKRFRDKLPPPLIQGYIIMGILFIAGMVVYALYIGSLYGKYLGVGLYFARGPAMGLMFLTGWMFLVMCRGLMTQIRRVECLMRFKILHVLLNEYRDVHRHAAWGTVILSLTHTFAHLFGTVPAIIQHDPDQLGWSKNLQNDILYKKEHNLVIRYIAMVGTQPALSGVLLLVVLAVLCYTSWKRVRDRNFELFWYTHHLFVVWVGLLIWHGARGWLNWGFPLILPIAGPACLIYGIERLIRVYRAVKVEMSIDRALVTESESAGMIYLTKPEGFKLIAGQIVWVNCPEVAPLEWHPFSMASCNRNQYLVLMVGNAGNWSGQLLHLLAEANRARLLADSGEKDIEASMAPTDTETLSNVKSPIKVEPTETGKPMKEYPRIRLDGPFGAPAQQSRFKKKLIYVGTGVGIAPFFSFIDKQLCLLADQTNEFHETDGSHYSRPSHAYAGNNPKLTSQKTGFEDFEVMHFFWVNRSQDEMLWLGDALKVLVQFPANLTKIKFHLYVTRPDDEQSKEGFLFLLGLREWLAETNAAVEVNFERPNFHKEFNKIINNYPEPKSEKRNQGWKVYVCGAVQVGHDVSEASKSLRAQGKDITVYEERF
eukprot:Platyproteum_vivax@DN3559_c0_g1_i1.p1